MIVKEEEGGHPVAAGVLARALVPALFVCQRRDMCPP